MLKRITVPLLLVALGALSANALADCPTCTKAKLENGWCDKCKMGFFAGIEMTSKKLFEALEGKPVANASELKCPGCKAAYEKNGTCEHCKVQFADHCRYASPAACCLAHGKLKNPAEMKCETCKSYIGEHGWCEQCKQGIVGNYAFTDKEEYNKAAAAQELIRKAVQAVKKCEGCAVAMVTDGTCECCKVSYKDGKLVSATDKPTEKSAEKPKP